MTATLAAPTRPDAGTTEGSQLAAAVLILDGRRYEWRADGLRDDPDVTAWVADAPAPEHPDYASLWWADLERMRAAHG